MQSLPFACAAASSIPTLAMRLNVEENSKRQVVMRRVWRQIKYPSLVDRYANTLSASVVRPRKTIIMSK
ncbi:hypothetical protein [Rhodoblastus sp.]|uniref:hypothetical protein n=1 Tax=Rhodoblastus sp. TaxID=1962975 RepID=UPI003F98FB38